MTLNEYFSIPEGLEISMKKTSFWINSKLPYSSNMSDAFRYTDAGVIKLQDTSNVTNMYYMFGNCTNLRTIPLIDTSNVVNMNNMFSYCNSLLFIPQLNTSKVTNMSQIFNNCKSLTTIPQLDTSKVTDMSRMFDSCTALISVPPLNAESVTTSGGIFGYSDITSITDFGGLIGLKASMTDSYSFQKVPNLTFQSCINILNGLYNFTEHNEKPTSTQGKLKVHQNFLNLVGEEISIATNKGWTITA